MANRKNTLIHLHGTTDLENGSILNLGEIAVKNAAAGSAKLFIKDNTDEGVITFLDAKAVDTMVSTAQADAESNADKATDTKLANYYTKTQVDTIVSGATSYLQGQIDTLVSGDASVGAQIEAAVEEINKTIGTVENGKTVVGMITEKADAAKEAAITSGKTYTDNRLGAIASDKTVAETIAAAAADAVSATDAVNKVLTAHTGNGDIHVTTADKAKWNAAEQNAKDYADGKIGTIANGKTVAQAIQDTADAAALTSDNINKALTAHTGNGDIHVTADDKAAWDKAVSDLNDFLTGTDTDNVVNKLSDIKAWMEGEGVVATELTEAIAGEADLRSKADKALSDRIAAFEDGGSSSVETQISNAITTATGYTEDRLGAIASDKTVAETIAAAEQSAKGYADGLDSAMDERVKLLEAIDHDHTNKAVLDGITAAKVSAWDAAEQNAKNYADGLDSAMNLRVAELEKTDHTHSNKALLDTYTQTEANLADAVSKKHNHANKAVLDGITSEQVAAWDKAVQDIVVTNTATNKVTATKNGTTVTFNFDSMVIDCGTY